MLIKIYILVDPISNQVRYVGKTCQSLSKRLNGHFFKKSRTHTSSWIKSLKSKNKIPIIELLDEVPEPEWIFWEQHYISLFKSWGYNLTNHSIGGEGRTRYKMPLKDRLHLSQINKGRKVHSIEGRKRIGQAISAYWAERKKLGKFKYQLPKISEKRKRTYVYTKAHKQNISHALKGKKFKFRKTTKKVLETKKDGSTKIWNSVIEASNFYKVNQSSIRHCIAGRKKRVKNSTWQYHNN